MDELYMQLALDAAWHNQLLTYPNPSVGAVLLHEGRFLCVVAHKKAGDSHAEVLALLDGYEALSNQKVDFDKNNSHLAHQFLLSLPQGFFGKCDMYVTLEPCNHDGKTPSCASLLAKLKLKSITIATLDPIKSHSGGAKRIEDVGTALYAGLLESKAKELLEPFVIWQKRAFVLFKLAQTTNGKITGGTISSLVSRTHSHKLRARVSKLVIGGSTVRIDRPTLDCRLSGDMPPDVFIYTKGDVDQSIPLFDIKDRDVAFGDKLDFLSKPSFILIEGGEGMLEAFKEKIDWLLVYQSPNIDNEKKSYNTNLRLKHLYASPMGEDLMIWSKRI